MNIQNMIFIPPIIFGIIFGPFFFTYQETGIASFYSHFFHGKTMANGRPFDMYGITAAHKTLPLGSICEVVILDTGESIVVPILDRGPYRPGRIIDLSFGAANKVGMVSRGIAYVKITVLAFGDDKK